MSDAPKISKQGYYANFSRELLDDQYEMQWPRKKRTVTHPITEQQRADYDDFKRRWAEASEAFQAVIDEGEKKRWASDAGGYDWSPAEIQELRPTIEYIYEETVEEWRARVDAIHAHYAETGEWLEEPKPSFIRMATLELLRALEGKSLEGQPE